VSEHDRDAVVIEDDPDVRALLVELLQQSGFSVTDCPAGAEGLRAVREKDPDLVTLDLNLPDLDGIEVCRRLRAEGEVAILMLTARDGTADRVRGLDSGADDYLLKPFAYEELMARVRALLRRGTVRTPRLLSYTDLKLDLDTREVSRGGRTVNLTAKEHELLEHLLRQPRRVFTRDQLLEGVWGIDSEAASNVVDVYVGYLRQKLEEGGEPRLLQTIRGVGYTLREE
jgi:two-component system response regulator MprA